MAILVQSLQGGPHRAVVDLLWHLGWVPNPPRKPHLCLQVPLQILKTFVPRGQNPATLVNSEKAIQQDYVLEVATGNYPKRNNCSMMWQCGVLTQAFRNICMKLMLLPADCQEVVSSPGRDAVFNTPGLLGGCLMQTDLATNASCNAENAGRMFIWKWETAL